VIATLTARLNATRMLQSRISLLKSYLAHLPASYLNDSTEPPSSDSSDSNALTTSYPVLRSISALVSRLALLTPASSALFDIESKAEQNDVNLINLLGTVGKGLGDARDIGRKFHVVENGKQARKGGGGGLGGGPVDGMRNPVDEILGQEMNGREGQQMGIRSNQWQS
jgi:COP9 signalosome complex subunit 6